MKSSSDIILASGINPFDKSYDALQKVFDRKVIELISETLNLNVTSVTTPLITDFEFYEKNADNWVVEQIVNGSADISSSTVILTPELQGVVSYSFGIGPFSPQLYYKARSLREDHNIYLIPFSSELWLCFITAVFLLMIVLTFILSREVKLPHKISYDVFARIIDAQQDGEEEFPQEMKSTSKEVLHEKEKWEMGEILLVCLGAACQQGSARDPSTNAARILILCLFGLAVVGYTAYSASLISIVSLFPTTELEKTRDVAYFSNRYKVFLHGIGKSKDLNLGSVKTKFISLKAGFDQVLKQDAVFVGDRDTSLSFLHQQKYDASIRCTLGRTFLGLEYQRVIVLKKNSNYKERINQNILNMKQSGLLNRERKRIFKTESLCTLKEKLSTSNFVSFCQNDVEPLIRLYTLGVATSLLLLVLENIAFLCTKVTKNQ